MCSPTTHYVGPLCLQPLVQKKHHILLGVLPAGDAQGADKKWAGSGIDDQSPEFRA